MVTFLSRHLPTAIGAYACNHSFTFSRCVVRRGTPSNSVTALRPFSSAARRFAHSAPCTGFLRWEMKAWWRGVGVPFLPVLHPPKHHKATGFLSAILSHQRGRRWWRAWLNRRTYACFLTRVTPDVNAVGEHCHVHTLLLARARTGRRACARRTARDGELLALSISASIYSIWDDMADTNCRTARFLCAWRARCARAQKDGKNFCMRLLPRATETCYWITGLLIRIRIAKLRETVT